MLILIYLLVTPLCLLAVHLVSLQLSRLFPNIGPLGTMVCLVLVFGLYGLLLMTSGLGPNMMTKAKGFFSVKDP